MKIGGGLGLRIGLRGCFKSSIACSKTCSSPKSPLKRRTLSLFLTFNES